jgi:hypothetical protein
MQPLTIGFLGSGPPRPVKPKRPATRYQQDLRSREQSKTTQRRDMRAQSRAVKHQAQARSKATRRQARAQSNPSPLRRLRQSRRPLLARARWRATVPARAKPTGPAQLKPAAPVRWKPKAAAKRRRRLPKAHRALTTVQAPARLLPPRLNQVRMRARALHRRVSLVLRRR